MSKMPVTFTLKHFQEILRPCPAPCLVLAFCSVYLALRGLCGSERAQGHPCSKSPPEGLLSVMQPRRGGAFYTSASCANGGPAHTSGQRGKGGGDEGA